MLIQLLLSGFQQLLMMALSWEFIDELNLSMNSKPSSLSLTFHAPSQNTALGDKALTDPSRGTFHILTITVNVCALSLTTY